MKIHKQLTLEPENPQVRVLYTASHLYLAFSCYDEYGHLPLSDRALLIKLTYWFNL
jgi:hypothetical protein